MGAQVAQRAQQGQQLGQQLDLDRGAGAAQLWQVLLLLHLGPDRVLAAQGALSEEAARDLGLARLWMHLPERV